LIKLGIDLDNTIICYDNLIHNLAKKKFPKIKLKKNIRSKKIIKNKIIKFYNNNQWTKLQGIIYGEKILDAKLFNNFKEGIKKLKDEFEIFIISHKTNKAAIGKDINLRNAAKKFLKQNDISFCKNELVNRNKILFASTQKEKIKLIKNKKIDIFIDDLDIILQSLPNQIKKIHFSKKKYKFENFYDWKKITQILLKRRNSILENKIKNITNLELKILRKMSMGTNNELYLTKINNSKYVLKIYKNKKQEISYIKEINFLKILKEFKEIPNLKISNNHYKFVIIDYISGKKIKKIEFKDIKKIIFFIKKIQLKINEYRKIKNNQIRFATDRIWDVNDILANIKSRIIKTNNRINSKDDKNISLIKINLRIKNTLKKLKKEIRCLKLNINQSQFECLSPSDFNIRNILISSKKFYFIDFEYSGIDNYYKLMLDFICQPDIFFNQKEINLVINEFSKINNNLKNNFDRSLIILNSIKWFYLILNSNYNNKFSKLQISKSIKYFKERIAIY
jgi:hypothetical protein